MRTNVRLFLMQIAPIFVASIPLKFSEMHEIGGHPKQSPHVLSYLPLERSSLSSTDDDDDGWVVFTRYMYTTRDATQFRALLMFVLSADVCSSC
jgi:hypothetical protein